MKFNNVIFTFSLMNKGLKKAFVAIKNNEAVVFDTNLKEFVLKLNRIEPETRNYMYYYREFEKRKMIEYVNQSGEVYNLQQIL